MAADFGMVGLGTMGLNLVLNIADKQIPVCGYDRDPEQQQKARQAGTGKPVQVATSAAELVASLNKPRRIMLLVPAGKITDAVIAEFSVLLEPGDILIDGGNSHFIDTDRRIQQLKNTGIHFTGMGVSGGEDGARLGPSLMPGGDPVAYAELKFILETIEETTVASKDFPLPVAENVESRSDARSEFIVPIEFDARISFTDRWDVFLFKAESKVKG